MEAVYYMEYRETKKFVEESAEAYFKFRNTKRWKMFRTSDVKTKAIDTTEERYEELKKISRRDRVVKVEFLEDKLVFTAGDEVREVAYQNIEKIYETDTILAVYDTLGKKKKDKFLCLKKGSVRGKSLADLKEFLLEKCKKANNEIIAL